MIRRLSGRLRSTSVAVVDVIRRSRRSGDSSGKETDTERKRVRVRVKEKESESESERERERGTEIIDY